MTTTTTIQILESGTSVGRPSVVDIGSSNVTVVEVTRGLKGDPGLDGVQSEGISNIVALTQEEYDALSPKSDTTIYLII